MLTDALTLLSSAQVVTTTAVSTNTIPMSQVRDLGPGHQLYAVFTVDATVTAAGAATVNFQVITSASAALTSPTIIAQTDAIGKAELTQGRRPIVVALNPSVLAAQPNGQLYLGVQYTVGTGPLTAGSFTCNIVDGPEVIKHYPAGYYVA